MTCRAAIFLLTLFVTNTLFAAPATWCQKLPRPDYFKLEKAAINDPWFEVYKISPDIFAIYEPHQSEEVISYLILGNKKALLFDTGMGIGNIKQLVNRLTSLPVMVINSHSHNDHVGDNWRFDEIYGLNNAFTRKNMQGSKRDAQAEIKPHEICGKLPVNFNAANYQTKPYQITHYTYDREKIDLGGHLIQVIITKGHTPDSIALYDNKHGILFVGDTFYLGPIYLYRPETNLYDYTQSLHKLSSIKNVKMLLVSHNFPVVSPEYLHRGKEALAKVLIGSAAAVKQGNKQQYVFDDFSFLMANKEHTIKLVDLINHAYLSLYKMPTRSS